MNKPNLNSYSGIRSLSDFVGSTNPSLPHANISNASYLMGDPDDAYYGDADDDFENGDPDDAYYGDADDDLALNGGPKRRPMKRFSNLSRQRKRLMGNKKANLAGMTPLFSLKGGAMVSAPVDTMTQVPTDVLKVAMDMQSIFTPFYQITNGPGVVAAPLITTTLAGSATGEYYHALFIGIGTNTLSGAPRTILTITAQLPLVRGGTLAITTPAFVIGLNRGFDLELLIRTPWVLVANRVIPILGELTNVNIITVVVNGLNTTAGASVVNLTVPGSLHPYTVKKRGEFARALRAN